MVSWASVPETRSFSSISVGFALSFMNWTLSGSLSGAIRESAGSRLSWPPRRRGPARYGSGLVLLAGQLHQRCVSGPVGLAKAGQPAFADIGHMTSC